MKVFLSPQECVTIMMRHYSKAGCDAATQAIVDQYERRYRCLCNFATKDHVRMDKHKTKCETWLEDGVRQWKAISNT